MTELEEYLFQFCAENRTSAYLHELGYFQKARAAERKWENLRQGLTPEQCELLETCQGLDGDADWDGRKALFQAALAMGLELGRLPMRAGQ